jgi:hypothetical protein
MGFTSARLIWVLLGAGDGRMGTTAFAFLLFSNLALVIWNSRETPSYGRIKAIRRFRKAKHAV